MKIILYRFLILLLTFIGLACSSSKEITESYKFVTREEWKALEPKPFQNHFPVRITIHHLGEKLTIEDDAAEKLRRVQRWGMGPDRKWSDMPYHFLVAPDGKVYEGRNVFTAGETNTEYDPSGHLLINALGNFEEQEISETQLNALLDFTAYCSVKYDIAPETITGHKDHAKTLCPGKNLYNLIETGWFQDEVNKRVKRLQLQ